jgi:hypothetical protein
MQRLSTLLTLNRATRYAAPLKRRTFRSVQIATPLMFSFKNGTSFGRSGKEPINSLKKQIDSAIKEQLSKT